MVLVRQKDIGEKMAMILESAADERNKVKAKPVQINNLPGSHRK